MVGTDGTLYGPAEMTVLSVWAAEGRVTPATMLEEEGTGQRLLASHVPGLATRHVAPGTPDPYAHPSYHSSLSPTSSGSTCARDLQVAWALGALSLAGGVGILCTPIGSVGGAVAGAFGITMANKALLAGLSAARGARTLNIVGVVLCALQLLAAPFWLFRNF